jgi:hypothetical protein
MDDLKLLKDLPGRIEPPDDETKERMRAFLQVRTAPPSRRRPRHAAKIAAIGTAAVLAVGTLAAGFGVHPWSDDDPVAIGGISDPTGEISTPADLESTVAEFAPAIHLPDGGSYEVWIRRHELPASSDIDQGLTRADVVHSMVFVSQCQWGQQWLEASDGGHQAAAGEALRVLGGINDWWRSIDPVDDFGTARLLGRMKSGDRIGVQSIENGCAYTGSWGNTPSEQNAAATGTLSSAVQTVQGYLRDGGDPAAFDPATAGSLAPAIGWTSSHMQPAPASPGHIFIGSSPDSGVALVSVSEAGTQFCVDVTDAGVQRGTTTQDLSTIETADGTAVNAKYPGPVTCTSGGW